MSSTYKFILIFLLLSLVLFGASPSLTLHNISKAAKANDQAAWPSLVKAEAFSAQVKQLVSGLSRLTMQAGIEGKVDLQSAAADFDAGKKGGVDRLTQELTGPQGFSHLLCGVVLSEPNAQPDGTTDCWALNGKLSWQSPTQAKVTFTNPETHWQSSLILERVGLFTWQAVSLELPDQAIVDHYAKAIGLDKTPVKRNPDQRPS
jgi:hypothetical protein